MNNKGSVIIFANSRGKEELCRQRIFRVKIKIKREDSIAQVTPFQFTELGVII